MIKSVLIGDSSEDVIYLLTVSDVAVGHTFLLFFASFQKNWSKFSTFFVVWKSSSSLLKKIAV